MAVTIKEGIEYTAAKGQRVGPMALAYSHGYFYVKYALGCWNPDGSPEDEATNRKFGALVSEWNESPIRTVTRRIIEDGQSGAISWKGHADGSIWISVSGPGAIGQYVRVNKSELTNVGLIISQLAEFLDEDKGDE